MRALSTGKYGNFSDSWPELPDAICETACWLLLQLCLHHLNCFAKIIIIIMFSHMLESVAGYYG
jgi:hypothetical protein